MLVRLFFILFPFLLTGCASTGGYKPPSGGPVAELKIPQFRTTYKLLGGFSGGMVQIAQMKPDGCAGHAMKVSVEKTGASKTINVAAEQPLLISVFRHWGNTQCRLNGIVTLKSTAHYDLNFGAAAGSRCAFQIHSKSEGFVPIKQVKPNLFTTCIK